MLLYTGDSAAELPVEAPQHFQLFNNKKTAETLGLPLPAMLLVSADQVIEFADFRVWPFADILIAAFEVRSQG